MAIYYLDPHTTTNGTGTWASPWSLTAAHPGLVTGDEIRIKSVPLTNGILTSSVYTATVSDYHQLTILNGGTDWLASDIGYIPLWDVFFMVNNKPSSNVLQCVYANGVGMLPLKDTSIPTLNIQKVNSAAVPTGMTTNAYFAGAYTSSVDNITISDGWVDATTRVTDGSVRSIIYSSGSSNLGIYLDTTQAVIDPPSNWNIQLNNTHILGTRTGTTAGISIYSYAQNSTYNIKQISGSYTAGGGFYIGTSSSRTYNNNYYVETLSNIGGLAGIYGSGHAFHTDRYINYDLSYYIPNSVLTYATKCTISNNYFVSTLNGNIVPMATGVPWLGDNTLQFNYGRDVYNNVSANYVGSAYGIGSITFNASYTIYINKRAAIQTSFINKYNLAYSYPLLNELFIPNITTPAWTYTSGAYAMNFSSAHISSQSSLRPSNTVLNFPSLPSASSFSMFVRGHNTTIVSRTVGEAPYEFLGVNNPSGIPNSYNNFPTVTQDTGRFRTDGPSLKMNLMTRDAGIWQNHPYAAKTIKIPVTVGRTYTITGYCYSDDTAYAQNDCRISLVQNSTELDAASISPGCINAWEQFTITYYSTRTEELILSWQMYFANGAKSMWLDDLTITET